MEGLQGQAHVHAQPGCRNPSSCWSPVSLPVAPRVMAIMSSKWWRSRREVPQDRKGVRVPTAGTFPRYSSHAGEGWRWERASQLLREPAGRLGTRALDGRRARSPAAGYAVRWLDNRKSTRKAMKVWVAAGMEGHRGQARVHAHPGCLTRSSCWSPVGRRVAPPGMRASSAWV